MTKYEKKLKELKKQLCELGIVIPGTIHVQYRKCGKANCRCHESQDNMHGPYYLWYRKVNGKLCTSVINEADVQSFKEMIANRMKLEKLTNEMIILGEHYISKEKIGKNNSKKT